MVWLLVLLSNLVWIIGTFLCGWLLFELFAFVPLPGWLEGIIVAILSGWLGLVGMAIFIGKFTGKSWAEWRKATAGLLRTGSTTGAACVVGIACYLFISRFVVDTEIQKVVVIGVALAFWFTVVFFCNKHLESQSDKERKDYEEQKAHNAQIK